MYPIVSISGFPGSGKSTICRSMRDTLELHYVDYDCFGALTNASPDILHDWIKAGMPYEALFSTEFSERVIEASRISPVLIETPLGPLHGADGIKVSLSIWLDVALDIALLRALTKVINEDWGSIRELRSWDSGYQTAYEAFVRTSLLMQQQNVGSRCDVTVQASRPSTDIAHQLCKEIADHLGLHDLPLIR